VGVSALSIYIALAALCEASSIMRYTQLWVSTALALLSRLTTNDTPRACALLSLLLSKVSNAVVITGLSVCYARNALTGTMNRSEKCSLIHKIPGESHCCELRLVLPTLAVFTAELTPLTLQLCRKARKSLSYLVLRQSLGLLGCTWSEHERLQRCAQYSFNTQYVPAKILCDLFLSTPRATEQALCIHFINHRGKPVPNRKSEIVCTYIGLLFLFIGCTGTSCK
jgi:hypothetical protein